MGDLLDSYNASVKDNPAVDAKVDKALVESGRTIARQIDYAVDHLEGQEVTKALYLMPHLGEHPQGDAGDAAVRATLAAGSPAEPQEEVTPCQRQRHPPPGLAGQEARRA